MASTVPKVRFVRCPKCRELLAEFANVPVYRCGKCDTILQAKHWRAGAASGSTSGALQSISCLENTSNPCSESGGNTLNDGLNSPNKQTVSCFTDSRTEETGRCKGALPSNTLSDSNILQGCQETGDTSENIGDENGDKVEAESGNSLGEQVEKSLSLDPDGFETSSSLGKMQGFHSSNHSVDSWDVAIEGDINNWTSDCTRSPANRSFHAYEGSVSSDDGLERHKISLPPKSRRTIRSQRLRQPIIRDVEEGDAAQANNKMRFVSQAWSQERIFASASGNARIDTEVNSVDSESCLSGPNWIESGKDASYRSRSSRDLDIDEDLSTNQQYHSRPAKFRDLKYEPVELMRNDELRGQFIGSHYQSGGGNRWSDIRETSPLFSSHESKHDFSPCYSSIPHHHSTESLPRTTNYQSSQMAFSSQTDHCCMHCQPENCRAFVQFPQGICCKNGMCRACSHSCCLPSNNSVSKCHAGSNLLCSPNTQMYDTEVEKLQFKDKEKTLKRYCRPVLGGTHFVICYKCSKLLQMPEDLHFSKRKRIMLRCGSCYEILTYSLDNGTHIVPRTFASAQHSFSQVEEDADAYTEDCGPSLGGSFSTDGESGPTGAGDKKKTKVKPLHRLMGYFSATDIIYQP